MRRVNGRGLRVTVAARVLLTAMVACGVLGALLLPPSARADGAWLDDESASWNARGGEIPRAPTSGPSINPSCPPGRPPESEPERAVVAAGWTLYGGFSRGGEIEDMFGRAGTDGMCRPMQFQAFYFVGGAFAGTISPVPMDSRADGSLSALEIKNDEEVTARFNRYTPQDALCCPSSMSTATFRLVRAGITGGPLLEIVSRSTQPVPGLTSTPLSSPAPAPTPTPATPRAPAQVPKPTASRVHTVEGGDTLPRIAARYGVTVEAIMEANGFSDRGRILRIGERLLIPDP